MKKVLFALFSGILLALGWPTNGFPLLLFFGFVPLLYTEFEIRNHPQKHSAWKVFGLAYLSFFIWNLYTTYWLYYASAAGMAFAVLANSLLMALVFLIYHKVANRISQLLSSLFLIALWMCFEYLHLHWQFSWPWLNLGNGFSEYPQWVQWYAYTGNFGGTLWVWGANILFFHGFLAYQKTKHKKALLQGCLLAVLLIGIPIGISYILWNNYPSEKNQPEIQALILQPNIDPYSEKYNMGDRQIGQLLDRMTRQRITDSTRIVIAPETVFAEGTRLPKFRLSAAHFYGEQIVINHPNASFLAGISMYEVIHNKDSVQPQSNYLRPGIWFNDYNTAFLLTPGKKPQFYNKSKLVVGVETFPYQNLLKPILGDIMIDLGGTVAKKTTQPNREVFTFGKNIKTAPIICYESVYGQFVNGYVKNGAQFLSIITNDAWWENTQGHKQHVSYARLRAIETRRDIAQSANTGTSAFINQKGEIVQSTQYNVRTALKGTIHLNCKKTFYVKHGDYLAYLAQWIATLIFLFTLYTSFKNKRYKNK